MQEEPDDFNSPEGARKVIARARESVRALVKGARATYNDIAERESTKLITAAEADQERQELARLTELSMRQ